MISIQICSSTFCSTRKGGLAQPLIQQAYNAGQSGRRAFICGRAFHSSPAPVDFGLRDEPHAPLATAANKQLLRYVSTSAAPDKSVFRVPNTDGFMGLPLVETQKVDPKDVRSFWKKHDPCPRRPEEFGLTDEGHSLMTEWDNGRSGLLSRRKCTGSADTQQVKSSDQSHMLLCMCRSLWHGGGVLRHAGVPKRHWTAHDSHHHDQQHLGAWWTCCS